MSLFCKFKPGKAKPEGCHLVHFVGYPDGGISYPGNIAITDDGNQWVFCEIDDEPRICNIHPPRRGVCGIRWKVNPSRYQYLDPIERQAFGLLGLKQEDYE